jgi:acetolactate synthase regulatory subunit
MNCTIEVNLARAEGAIVRTLGLIERRGFIVESVATAGDSGADSIVMRVEVASHGRPVDVLVRQILRLIDVRQAFLVKPQAAGQRLVC